MRFFTLLRFVLNDSKLTITLVKFGGAESLTSSTPELPCTEMQLAVILSTAKNLQVSPVHS